MREVILFIMTFITVFIVYQLFIVSKRKKVKKKYPMEVNYLIYKYKIDIDKVNYKKLLRVISVISSLDISILVTIVLLFDSYLLQIIVALLLVIPIIMISYGFIGRYYVKKGMIKDE